jgi:hypothetical protein
LPFNVPGLDFHNDVMQGFALHSVGDLRSDDPRIRFQGCGDKILTVKSGMIADGYFSLAMLLSLMRVRRLIQVKVTGYNVYSIIIGFLNKPSRRRSCT